MRAVWTWTVMCLLSSCLAPATAGGQDLGEVELGDAGYVVGDPDAPVSIVEFGDFACSACAEFHRDTWPRVRESLVETGRVSWRHVPFLLGFARGDEAANAAECAAEQGSYWGMHDRLFAAQAEWTRGRRPERVFLRYAEELGIDPEAFEECYDEERWEDRTRAFGRLARDAGVRGTPTFFIAGRPAVGALPYEMFLGLVTEAETNLAGSGAR